MAFFVDLWESVFTPGPTPVLLRAANLTFLALQLLLALLLAATSSAHFVVLSVLCAGLWRAVNWFAAELEAAQAQAASASSASAAASATAASPTPHVSAATTAPGAPAKPSASTGAKAKLGEDSDTEVEGEPRVGRPRRRQQAQTKSQMQTQTQMEMESCEDSEPLLGSGAQVRAGGEVRRRPAHAEDADEGLAARGAHSSASTEDEWERVSESEERQ